MSVKELGKKIGDKIILPVPFSFSVSITGMGLRFYGGSIRAKYVYTKFDKSILSTTYR